MTSNNVLIKQIRYRTIIYKIPTYFFFRSYFCNTLIDVYYIRKTNLTNFSNSCSCHCYDKIVLRCSIFFNIIIFIST